MLSSVSLFWQRKDFKRLFISNILQNKEVQIHMNNCDQWTKLVLVKLGVFEKDNSWLTVYYCKEMCFSINVRTTTVLRSISICSECTSCALFPFTCHLSIPLNRSDILFIRECWEFCFKSRWELQVFTAKHFDSKEVN